jgi:hypothetical protein
VNTLIAVAGCWHRGDRTQAQRDTWAREAGAWFFVGRKPAEGWIAPSQTFELDVDDSYAGLPEKVRGICRWGLENGFDSLCKLDDDVYMRPERLDGVLGDADYVGRFRAGYDGFPRYSSGFTYMLSRRAMEIIAHAELTADPNEDRWVGTVLHEAGVRMRHEARFCCPFNGGLEPCGERIWHYEMSQNIAWAQLSPDNIRDMDKWYKIIKPKFAPLFPKRRRRFR